MNNTATRAPLRAVYSQGSIRTIDPIDLPDGTEVQLELRVVTASGANLPIDVWRKVKDDPRWIAMEEIWEAQRRRGYVPPSGEQIDAEIAQMRDEWEERQLELDHINILLESETEPTT